MAHPHADSGFRSLTRYEEYYLPGGDLFLLVEQHIFRVHRYFFERESTYFKGKLATPASPGSQRPGTSESNAILLDDVRVHEFARFLWVFYNPKYSLYHTSVADWTAILTLAHRWAFAEVKALAVRELEKQIMPDIERVVVYQNNDCDRNLLIRCYAALCERDEPLTHAEGRRMGIDTALTIAQLREMARRSPIDCRSPTSANIRGHDLFALVRELFGIATPIRDDDSVPQTPLGGPTPSLWLGSPVTAQTATKQPAVQQPTVRPPPPAKPKAQTATPATTPPPLPLPPTRTAPPPLPAAPPTQTEPEPEPEPTVFQPLEPTPAPAPATEPTVTEPTQTEQPPPPPPPTEKPERPQVITNPALAKLNQQEPQPTETASSSRPSTPASETPTTGPEKEKKEKKKKTKKTKKAAAAAAAAAAAMEKVETDPTGSQTPKPEEKDQNVQGGTELVDVTKQDQLGQGEEKKKDDVGGQILADLEKKGDEKKDESGGVASEEKEKEKEAESSGIAEGGKVEGGDKDKAKAGAVSTDSPGTTTDHAQVNDVKTPEPKASPTTTNNPFASPRSPIIGRKNGADTNEYLKSPQDGEKAKSPGLIGSFWNKVA